MPMPLTLTIATPGLIVKVALIEPSGYCEYKVLFGSYHWHRGHNFPEGTKIATALSHLLSMLGEDTNYDLTRYDYLTNADMLLGSVDMARTLVEHGQGELPTRMFIEYARDVVPS